MVRKLDETEDKEDHEPKSLVNMRECLLLSGHRNEERGLNLVVVGCKMMKEQ